MPIPDLEPTRRGLLAGAAAVLLAGAVTACDLDAGGLGGDSSGGASDGPAASQPEQDPDATLLDTTLQDLTSVAALVAATSAAHPALAPALAGLVAAHARHREVLLGAAGSSDGPVPDSPTTSRVPRRAAAALADVRRLEAAHARRLSSSALRAQSGPFARLLAVMGAGIAQHLAVLPARPLREGPA